MGAARHGTGRLPGKTGVDSTGEEKNKSFLSGICWKGIGCVCLEHRDGTVVEDGLGDRGWVAYWGTGGHTKVENSKGDQR